MLTEHLCAPGLHDPREFETEIARMPPERQAAARASFARRLPFMLRCHEETLAPLLSAGLTRDDFGVELDPGRAWWGMAAMIASEEGSRLISQSEGQAIGGEVGYGPARCFTHPSCLR
jgi:hypothetical protein